MRLVTTRIVQITDLHLLANPQERLRGVPVYEAVSQVVRHVRQKVPDAARLIISGDLAQDELAPTYDVLCNLLGDWLARTRAIPGNHDNRFALRRAFEATTATTGDEVGFVDDVDSWRLIGLDTQLPGAVAGEVAADHLAWLAAQLSAASSTPTLLFMHHPPVQVDTPWLDSIGLRNADRFADRLSEHPQVQLVCCGHVHLEHAVQLGATQVVTTPSAAFQFAPNTPTQSYDYIPPGYRVIELTDGKVESRVVRLPELVYPPE